MVSTWRSHWILRAVQCSRYERCGPHSLPAGSMHSDSTWGALDIVSLADSELLGCLSCFFFKIQLQATWSVVVSFLSAGSILDTLICTLLPQTDPIGVSIKQDLYVGFTTTWLWFIFVYRPRYNIHNSFPRCANSLNSSLLL